MAKDLHNLIKIHDWSVDEKRRKLGELLRLLDNLEAQEQALEEELAKEQETAIRSPDEAGYLYGEYAETVIKRRECIRESILQMEKAVNEAREELRYAYVELKKYEVAQENREKRAILKKNQSEQIETDAVGLEGFRRKLIAG